MVLDIQTRVGMRDLDLGAMPESGTPAHVNLYVDWVVAYAKS